MSSAKAKETESNNSIFGLTQPLISTPTPSFGTPNALCKCPQNHQILMFFDSNFIILFKLTIRSTKPYNAYIDLIFFLHFSFSVDGTPIREYKNAESVGVSYPKNQPMRIYSSLWNADDWATRGGLVKTDWTQAPFTASYRNFKAEASNNGTWLTEELDSTSQERLKWVQNNYMIYNYCTDTKRYPQGLPKECNMS